MGKAVGKSKLGPSPVQQQDAAMADAADDSVDGSSSGDEDDSSSDDNSDVEADPESITALMDLEAAIEDNPNLYDKHLEYVSVLRRCRLRMKLRAAQDAFAERFPLSEPLWLAAINDELGQVKTREDIERVQQLFERAVHDYLSVPLWMAYLRFVCELDPEVSAHSGGGAERFRALCQRALTAAGLHVTAAGALWALWRDYESTAPGGSDKADERVRALYHRQLAVPLADGPQTLAALEAWEAARGKTVPAAVKKSHAKAQEAVTLRQPYESAVAEGKAADPTLLAAYVAYIKLEQAQDDPARVQCVYERAVALFPVTAELWMQYGRYLEAHLRIPAVTNAVYTRGLRNCTWAGALWARALCALERGAGGPAAGGTAAAAAMMAEHDALFKRALEAGLQGPEDYMEVLLARLDALRRAVDGPAQPGGGAATPVAAVARLRAGFQQAMELMTSYFPEHLDRTLRLPGYFARTEALLLGDDVAARAVWDGVLKTNLSRYFEPWAACALQERWRRNVKEARAVYKRGCAKKLEEGGAALLAAQWLAFEREEGSVEDLFVASVKAEPLLEEAAAVAAAEADAQASAMAKAAAKQAPQLTRDEVAKLRQEADPSYKLKTTMKKKKKKATKEAAKAEVLPEQEADAAPAAAAAVPPAPAADDAAPAAKAVKSTRVKSASGLPKRAAADPLAEGAAAKRARTQEPPAAGLSSAAPPAAAAAAAAAAHAGPSSAAAAAAEALPLKDESAMDEDVAGPSSRTPAPAPASTAQPAGSSEDHAMGGERAKPKPIHTAFVRGLRQAVSDAEVHALFSPTCADLKAVRLMREPETNRFRGFGFVDFSSEAGLLAALNLNGSSFQGKDIVVLRPQPPGPAGEGGRGGGRGAAGGRGGRFDGGGGRGDGGGRAGGRAGRFDGGGRGGRFDGGGRGGSGGFHSGGGGGRGGLGYQGGGPGHGDAQFETFQGHDGGPRRGGHVRLQLDTEPATRPATQFVPRAVVTRHAEPMEGVAGAGAGGDGGAAPAPAPAPEAAPVPKSNADFRAMMGLS